jgi:hypothetical protein
MSGGGAGGGQTKPWLPMDDKTKFKKEKLPLVPLAQNAGQRIQVGIFFDGTDNNREDDLPFGKETNIAKLYDLYYEDKVGAFKTYIEGVGTGSILESDYATGGFSGRGITYRIWRACKYLSDIWPKNSSTQVELYVFGFSRGAATALSFINQLTDWNLFGKAFVNLPSPFPKIKFLGLFDTVGSICVPGTEAFDMHDLTIHQNRIQYLTHLVSKDEKRVLFPLTSIHSDASSILPNGWEERIFPGAHSDVGGGYSGVIVKSNSDPESPESETAIRMNSQAKSNDLLSRIPGWAMYDAAKKQGAPFFAAETHDPALQKERSLQSVIDNLNKGNEGFDGRTSPEDPDHGWTTFSNPDFSHPQHSFDRLKIHPDLRVFWKARNNPVQFDQLCGTSDWGNTILRQYMHDSQGREAIRNIFYKGAI